MTDIFRLTRWKPAAAGLLSTVLFSATLARAAQPVDWQIGMQPAASEIMEKITWFNNFTLIIITVITLFVTGLLHGRDRL